MKDIFTLIAATGTKIKPVDPNPDDDVKPTGNDLTNNIVDIINRVVLALGIVCVVVVIIGGINYMTSQGDPGKVKKARDTILYGVIGLIICALAFAIVNFVIKNVLK